MFELNKFKIFTLLFILLFIFSIAAMYTNTKDIVNGTAEKPSKNNEQSYYPEQRSAKKNDINSSVINSLSNRVSDLEQKLSDITDNENSDSDKLNCDIKGFMSGDILVPVSEVESLKEAKENGKELVMLCSFK